jgi:ATP-binding cassette, subfamily B, bacterial MsbA
MADPDTARATGKNSGDWSVYRRLLGYARPYRWRLALGILFGLLCGGSTGGVLLTFGSGMERLAGEESMALTRWIREQVGDLVATDRTSLYVTLGILAMLVLFAALRGIGFYFSKYYVEWVGHRVVTDIRNALFAHIQDLPLLSLSRNRTGELMSRTTSDTQMVERGVSTVIGDLAREPFVLLAATISLLSVDLGLAGITLVLFPVCVLPVAVFGRKVRRFSREGQAKLGDLASIQQETISGSRIVKAFGTEEREKERFSGFSNAVFRRQVRVTRARAAVTPIIELISVITGCALLLYARWSGLSLSQVLLFLASLVVMYDPVKKLSRIHLGIQQASGAADRIFEVLDLPISVRESPDARPFAGEPEVIRFEGVSFRYEDEWVLRDINLEVRAGECIALVGSSGAGKTTLVSLLPRFYDTTEGRVTLNARDIRGLTLKSLRSLIGIVTQETVLFNRTVAENIAYGLPEATRSEIEHAARRAHAHDFILAMPNGYDTVIAERGLTSSPAASASASPSPAPSCATRPSSSSTKPPAPSTPNPNAPSSSPSTKPCRAAPSSPSPTASPPSSAPTRSSSCTRAASSSSPPPPRNDRGPRTVNGVSSTLTHGL